MFGLKNISLLYGRDGMELFVPDSAAVLEGAEVKPLPDPETAVRNALADPIGAPSLNDLLAARKPQNVAITISDITRPVPNRVFLPPMLECLNACGVKDSGIVIIIGTGMHRPSTEAERKELVGQEVLDRVEVIDHQAEKPETLVRVSDDPPVSICRRFVEADFRIVTGLIEPHFMAGFSGGRKGVCPALADLGTIQRFHGYKTLSSPDATTGQLTGNPCHEIAVQVAEIVGVDLLFNVAICRDRQLAGIFCGDLKAAHEVGCRQVAEWTTVQIDRPFDLVVTNGGGYPLDQTFYQTVKGMCTALPALGGHSTLLQASQCAEGIGSAAYTELMLRYDNDWRRFLANIEAAQNKTLLDQWEYQMQTRVLERIGRDRLWFASDGISQEMQQRISVTPVPGGGCARERAQSAINRYVAEYPDAGIAVIPDGPYTLIQCNGDA